MRVSPPAAWACHAIFMATSTETEPESAKNTFSSAPFSPAAGPGARSTSWRPSRTAGSWVRPPNITWLIRPSCSTAAASSSGTAYPWIAHHHDDIASTTSTGRSSYRSRSRTPDADSTGYTSPGEVIDE